MQARIRLGLLDSRFCYPDHLMCGYLVQAPMVDLALQSSLYMVHLQEGGWSIKVLCLLGPEAGARRYSVP